MCKRLALDELPWATLSSLWLEDQELDGVGAGALRGEVMEVLAELLEPWAPRRNMVPIQDMLIIRSGYAMGALGDPQDNHQIDLARWGLIPGWANRRRTGERLLCAPAHAALATPAFRRPMRTQRCLIPVSAYYDWLEPRQELRPDRFAHAERDVMLLAGLWDQWTSPAGELIESFAVVTTEANAIARALGYQSMPTVLDLDDARLWLDPSSPLDLIEELAHTQLAAEHLEHHISRRLVPDISPQQRARRRPVQLDMIRQLQEEQRQHLLDESVQTWLPMFMAS